MKKINYFLIGAAGLLLASCSQEEVKVVDGKPANVEVTINLPEALRTRAVTVFGEGYVASDLYVVVYDGETGAYVEEAQTTFPENALSTNVYLNLTRGKQYTIACFAQSPNSSDVYTVNSQAGHVTVDYSSMTSAGNLNDDYDCFYGAKLTPPIAKGMNTLSITLYRPVAQINWGAADLYGDSQTNPTVANNDKAYGANGQYVWSTLTTNAYTQLNLIDGTMANQTQVTLGNNQEKQAFAAPWQMKYPYVPENMTTSPYAYIAMQYVLAPIEAADEYNLTLDISNQGNTSQNRVAQASLVVANAPVQANYQTNIYGELLSGDANFAVKKVPGWNGSFDKNY